MTREQSIKNLNAISYIYEAAYYDNLETEEALDYTKERCIEDVLANPQKTFYVHFEGVTGGDYYTAADVEKLLVAQQQRQE